MKVNVEKSAIIHSGGNHVCPVTINFPLVVKQSLWLPLTDTLIGLCSSDDTRKGPVILKPLVGMIVAVPP